MADEIIEGETDKPATAGFATPAGSVFTGEHGQPGIGPHEPRIVEAPAEGPKPARPRKRATPAKKAPVRGKRK